MNDGKHITTLKNENFDSFVFSGDLPVLVKFGTEWSGPCHIMRPILNDLAEKFLDEVKFGQLDIDQFPRIAQRFYVRTIPTLVIIRDGEIVDREQGVISKNDLENKLRKLVDDNFD